MPTNDPNVIFSHKDNAALWIQPGGPNTPMYYLGCHDLGDVSAPAGGITLIQCFDGRGGWKTIGSTVAPPDPITANIGTYLGKTLAWIEKIKCPAALFVLLRDCDRPDIPTNWVRAMIMDLQAITTRNYPAPVSKSEDGALMVNVDVEAAPPLTHVFQLTPVRQTIAETANLAGIASCSDDRCAGPCGGALNAGDILITSGKALAASPANKGQNWLSADAGATWTAEAADPFAGGEDIGPVICFGAGRSTVRRMVARGETDVANPAEIAYSDDGGVTWNLVNVGSVNGQFAVDADSLFALDYSHIWLVTSGGYIYFSGDGGLTWSTQSAGLITTQNLSAIHFMNSDIGYAVGASNVVLKTLDGGANWAAASSGPIAATVLNTVWVTPDGRVWVGAANGKLYYSNDGGVTWTERTFVGSGAGSVEGISFYNKQVGFMIQNTAAPIGYVHYTIDGGYSWQRLSLVTNAGLFDLAVVNERLAYVVGNASGGTAVILKVSGG